MRENADNYNSSEGKGKKINWACKIYKDLPTYANYYLIQRECEKKQPQNEETYQLDLMLLKYYFALLHLFSKIFGSFEYSNLENNVLKYEDLKGLAQEYLDYYHEIYNTYKHILASEMGIHQVNFRCDICNVLPYTILNDLNFVANNMYSDDIENTQKIELEAVIIDYYLRVMGSCEPSSECPTNGGDWLELIKSRQLLKEYLETKDREELRISLSDWNKARAIDNILNIKTISKDFQIRDIPLYILEKKKLVYMDFGVYQLYETNEVFHAQVDKYVETEEIQFVYSPTHMEEVCRMGNVEFENKRRNNISKVCNNHEVLPVGDGKLKILIEPVDVCYNRAKKLQTLNQHAEESECATFEALEEKIRKLVGWNEKEAEKRKKEISTLASTQLFDPKNKTMDNESINKIFYGICHSQLPIEDFKDYCKNERIFLEIRESVRLLYLLMNSLGYHRNKIEKRTKLTSEVFYPIYSRKFYRTIRSGFYDVDHISYATKCNYFVTCDYTLSLQAREIYRYLGCKTNVIYCKRKVTDSSLPF